MEPYFMLSLSTIGALILVGISLVTAALKSIKAEQSDQGERMVRIETVLTGADGTNGLNGDVKRLKEWQREMEGEALARRVTDLERRHGPADRRHLA